MMTRKLNTLQIQLKMVREEYLKIRQMPGTEPVTGLNEEDDGLMYANTSDSSSEDDN